MLEQVNKEILRCHKAQGRNLLVPHKNNTEGAHTPVQCINNCISWSPSYRSIK